MIRRVSIVAFSLLLAVLIMPLGLRVSAAQSNPPQYFPETGYTVDWPFIDYFVATGGAAHNGLPISSLFNDPVTGLTVQYFEMGRLEWHPGNPDPYKIQWGLLGVELGVSTPPIPVSQIPSPADPNCLYFEETGHKVCHIFLKKWQAEGLDRIGYPITELTIEDQRLVQYFQRAKMEYRPQREGEQTVLLPLGLIYRDVFPERIPDTRTPPSPSEKAVKSLKVTGSVSQPVIAPDGLQEAYVVIKDQLGNAVPGVAVTLQIRYSTGDQLVIMPLTDAQGVTRTTFSVSGVKPGALVPMGCVATLGSVFNATRTSFLVWFY
jgi:hypothetical protein